MFIRQYFYTYYELRRRFRSWKRQLFYHPNQTYQDLANKGTFVKFCTQLLVWNLVAIFAIKRFFNKELTSLNEKGIEAPKFSELWNEIRGRWKENDDTRKYYFKNPLHYMTDSAISKRKHVDLTKAKFPLDDI
ncbi:unnamed protein product [Meloidogyne enterolobii]|uniref:Uncharacterized protein n=1 Tax=Meloidogyne enterolobii TaxID=390850 RepID=A0ACB0XPW7_MELEN